MSEGRGQRERPYDLIVIGGGINGAGIARDAILRGLSVALFEQRDYSTGATWASSGMIHGGVRYLLHDAAVTKLSCTDSGYIQKIAPHLIFRIPFIVPVLADQKASRAMLTLMDVYFQRYDTYAPLKGGKPHARLTGDEARALEPGLSERVVGALTMDEWGIDASRLNSVNALAAQEGGADCHTYHRVEGLLRAEGGRVVGVRVYDRIDGGSRREVFGRVVFNATGAWSEAFARSAAQIGRVRVRPGKGIHIVYPGRLTNYAVAAKAVDGRQVFICPQQNTTLLGTTDDDYYGDLDHLPILEDEVAYLLQGMRSVFPSIDRFRPMMTTSGCRPTIHAYGPYEDDLSREHLFFDHAQDGAAGMLSVIGGKLASYRILAQEGVDRVVAALGERRPPCSTHLVRLPGGEDHDLTVAKLVAQGLDAAAASRLLYRQGSRAPAVLERIQQRPCEAALVCPCEPLTEAELRHVIQTEHVRTLDDCARRCRLAVGPCQGARCIGRASQIFVQEKGLSASAAADVALGFHAARWVHRVGIMGDAQLAQEELLMGWNLLSSGTQHPLPLAPTPTPAPTPALAASSPSSPPASGPHAEPT
jgi:glycerol-3-phosphate dehydrogenase